MKLPPLPKSLNIAGERFAVKLELCVNPHNIGEADQFTAPFEITIDPNLTLARQWVTLWHEIAHLLHVLYSIKLKRSKKPPEELFMSVMAVELASISRQLYRVWRK